MRAAVWIELSGAGEICRHVIRKFRAWSPVIIEGKMAEASEGHSINADETAPLLQEHVEESNDNPSDNGAGELGRQTKSFESLPSYSMAEYLMFCLCRGAAIMLVLHTSRTSHNIAFDYSTSNIHFV